MQLSNRFILTALTLASLSFARAQENLVLQQPVDPNLRFGVTYDHRVTPSGTHGVGFEIGYAQRIYPLDQMVITYGHMSRASVEQNYVIIAFEEHYPLTERLSLYGNSGVGFMKTDIDNQSNREGIFGKIALGIFAPVCSSSTLYAEAQYQIAEKRLWVDRGSFDRQNVLFSIGFRYAF